MKICLICFPKSLVFPGLDQEDGGGGRGGATVQRLAEKAQLKLLDSYKKERNNLQ